MIERTSQKTLFRYKKKTGKESNKQVKAWLDSPVYLSHLLTDLLLLVYLEEVGHLACIQHVIDILQEGLLFDLQDSEKNKVSNRYNMAHAWGPWRKEMVLKTCVTHKDWQHVSSIYDEDSWHNVCTEHTMTSWCWCWSLLCSIILYSRADSLRSHVILNEWIAFYSTLYDQLIGSLHNIKQKILTRLN